MVRTITITESELDALASGEPFGHTVERDGALIRYSPNKTISMMLMMGGEMPFTQREHEDNATILVRDVDIEALRDGRVPVWESLDVALELDG